VSDQPDTTEPETTAPDPTGPDSPLDVPQDVDTLDVAVAELRPALEAILMVTDEPLDQVRLASVVGHPVDDVEAALVALAAEYAEQGRGFDLRSIAGGWRFYSRPEFAGVVESFVLEGQQARLTQAALETLSVVAYKQPVSRARVSAIRGVNVDGVMRTLLSRGLVEEAGQDEQSGANLYRTTSYFLERIGIATIDELPELAPYLPDMDDLEDELASVAGLDVPAAEAVVEPSAPTEPAAEPAPAPAREPAPEHTPIHPSPHSGAGTEPDGGTETT
jgi:segregation and condensation protein B